jgi:hypothetical protein
LPDVAIEKNVWVTAVLPFAINVVPPDSVIVQWEEDYNKMKTMIYGKSLSFSEMIDKIRQLNKKINQIVWQKTSLFSVGSACVDDKSKAPALQTSSKTRPKAQTFGRVFTILCAFLTILEIFSYLCTNERTKIDTLFGYICYRWVLR